MIEAGVEHFPAGSEPGVAGGVGLPERTDQDVARGGLEIGSAGQQPLQDRADPPDFLNGFVGDVNNGMHRKNAFR